MSDTPATDREENNHFVNADFARKLEVALRRAIRFVDAFEPRSRAAELDQQETLRIARDVLSNTDYHQ